MAPIPLENKSKGGLLASLPCLPMRTKPPLVPAKGSRPFGTFGRALPDKMGSAGIVIGGALLALVLRLIMLGQPGHFGGMSEYDDAVYFGASVMMTHGVFPYRDFVMVQPPGVPVLMLPVALFAKLVGTRTALEATRVITVLVSVADVALIGYIMRRYAKVAILIAVLVAAGLPPFIWASQTLILEPYLDLFCLAGIALLYGRERFALSRSRILVGGAMFGIAGTMKLWAFIPFMVLLVMMWRRSSRNGLYFALGAGSFFALVCLPFLVIAPGGFVHQVIFDQLARSDIRTPLATRLGYLGGSGSVVGANGLWAMVALVSVEWLLIVAPYIATKSRPKGIEAFALWSAALIFASTVIPANFYYHYAAFYAPFFALSIGLSIRRWLVMLPKKAIVTVGAFCLALASAVVGFAYAAFGAGVRVDPSALVQTLIPKGACVLSDTAEITLLSNRFSSSIQPCPVIVDAFGTDIASGSGVAASANVDVTPRLEDLWMKAFTQAQYVVLSDNNAARIPWTGPLVKYFAAHFHQVGSAGVAVFDRSGPTG